MSKTALAPAFAIVATCAATLVPITASAQLEEIVVTAERRETSAQSLPAAINAFSEERLENFGVTNVQELQVATPGLIVGNSGPTMAPYLRGIGSRLAAPGLEPSVSTYVDDRYISQPVNINVDLVDVNRVEVLKGPQGTFFGRNATGGAIRIITNNPTDEFEGHLKLSTGNYDYRHISGVVNLPIADGLALRVAGQWSERDGFADNLVSAPGALSDIDDEDNYSIRAKLLWDISERASLLLTGTYYERDETRGQDTADVGPPSRSSLLAAGAVTGTEPDEFASLQNQPSQSEEITLSAEIRLGFDAFEFVSTSVYMDMDKNTLALDSDGTSARATDVFVYRPYDSFSQEFRVMSKNDSNLSWLFGLYYYEEEATDEVAIDAGLPQRLSLGHNTVDITSAAAFAQFEWRFQPRWTLIVGGRYSYEEKETELVNSTRPEVAATLTAPLPYTDKDDWNEFTPRVTLQYQLDNVMLYGTYARGFKSGGFNYPLLTAGVPQPVLEPEILDMYEVGAKGQLYDNKIRYDASLYFYDYSDLQVTRSVGGTTVVTENAANAKVFGLDLNVDWAPMENWLISFNMSLLDTEYEDYIASTRVYGPTTGTVPVPFDADGHEMIRAPDWSANISSSYEFRIGERRLPVVVSYSYKDDYYFDFVAAPTMSVLKQDGYGILNARMTYFSASEVWSISIWGKNLTDKEYLNEAATIASGIRGSWGDPRTYGVDVQFNFGGS